MPLRPSFLRYLSEPYHPNQQHNLDLRALFSWSDASLMDEIGGCGFFITKHIAAKSGWRCTEWRNGQRHMGTSFDITILELWAAHFALQLIRSAPPLLLHDIDTVYLLIDNKPVVKWTAGVYTAQETYARDLLIRLYRVMDDLHARLAINFVVQWCRRGQWYGNQRADEIAKQAVHATAPITSIPSTYHPHSHGVIKTVIKRQLARRRHAAYSQTTQTHLL